MKDSDADSDPLVLTRDRARALRAAQTEVERRLWQRLRNRQLNGMKFRRQHPLGSYITDFFCLDARLIVELDGSQHGEEGERRADERRTEYPASQGSECCVSGTRRFWTTSMAYSRRSPEHL
jgi:very-short-patch-repair endonuclease